MSLNAKGRWMERNDLMANIGSSLNTPPSQSSSTLPSSTKSVQSTSIPQITQPATFIPLTTTFTPPASCTENLLTMLPSPGYQVWANEPVPVANQTSTACYPSEFLRAYQAVTIEDGSSVVPAMSPLVCPSNYCTMFAGNFNYVACCPSGYQFHPPDTTVDPQRPAYGGTCYSSFAESSTYTVIAYDVRASTRLAPFVPGKRDQAFAHPIDGFASVSAAIGCSDHAYKQQEARLSRKAIAGVSIGAIGALASIITMVWFLLRLRRKHRDDYRRQHRYYRQDNQPPPRQPLKIVHLDHDITRTKLQRAMLKSQDFGTGLTDADLQEKCDIPDFETCYIQEKGPFEVSGDSIPELDASPPRRSAIQSWKVRVLGG